jgi:SAM-dependent methyltransferase
MSDIKKDKIRGTVREHYAKIAKSKKPTSCGSSCCSNTETLTGNSAVLGYSKKEINSVPDGADMGLGCGNPQAIADLKKGETVLDLGSGGGFDCFLAAKQVGKSGKVIGVDMTPDMISKSRELAEIDGYKNVEFRLAEIENLPVADKSIDVIISNCVINLSPDKARVFAECSRVLRKGGRLAISDIVAIKPLPKKLKEDAEALCGCVAGAALVSDIEKMLGDSGFKAIKVAIKEESGKIIKEWFPESGAEKYIRSAIIEAKK